MWLLRVLQKKISDIFYIEQKGEWQDLRLARTLILCTQNIHFYRNWFWQLLVSCLQQDAFFIQNTSPNRCPLKWKLV